MAPHELSAWPRVIRIPRSDIPSSFALLRITCSGGDFSIAATEGETPYTGTVQQSHLNQLRAKNYQGTDAEWQRIVSHVLGDRSNAIAESLAITGVESSASIVGQDDENRELVITIRKRIQGITQRLGSLSLAQDDEQAIELFDWTAMAVARAEAAESHLTSLRGRYRAAEETIDLLNKQLEEFILAKNQHEELLMADVAQLLNQKKLKIRNQQRLLATATVDAQKLSELQIASFGSNRTPAPKSRESKRSARHFNHGHSDSEYEFEEMEVDQPRHQGTTREVDVDEDEDGQQSASPLLEDEDDQTTDGESSMSPAEDAQTDKDWGSKPSETPKRPTLKQQSQPPPRRELPFGRGVQAKTNSPEARSHQEGNASYTGGETDDDEL